LGHKVIFYKCFAKFLHKNSGKIDEKSAKNQRKIGRKIDGKIQKIEKLAEKSKKFGEKSGNW
jgi:hypothetical protein